MTALDIKIELTEIQLYLNNHNIELNKEDLGPVECCKIQAHNDVIIEAIEQLKQKL